MRRVVAAGALAVAVCWPTPVEAKHVDAIWPCAYFQPHTGDDLFYWAWNNESNPYVDTADCAADHPTGGQHLYCVIEWHHFGDGTPINPPGYTWQSGFC